MRNAAAPWIVVPVLLGLLAAGCSEDAGGADARVGEARTAEAAELAVSAKPAAAAPTPRREPPLPAFEGATLDDGRLALTSLLGRRLLLFLFNPDVPAAEPVGRAVAAVAQRRGDHNFEVIGIVQGAGPDAARAFLERLDLEAPAILDPSGSFGARVGLRVPVAVVLVDAEGYMVQASAGAGDSDDPATVMEAVLREWLRLPGAGADAAAGAELRPQAPDFSAERLEGGERFELASLRGRPAILVFFLHTCPHCHSALAFFRDELAALPEDSRPALMGISVLNRTHAVQQSLREEGLDFFPVLLDADGSIRSAYGAVAGVPVTFLLDAEGRIVSRTEGWREDREPPLMKMRLAKLAGRPVPMLLHSTGYSGNEFCAVCHTAETETWEITNHAAAFDTLVRHAADRRADCVGCHVVGFGEPDGYQLASPNRALEDVGCETCHGRGGPHLSPEFVKGHDYQAVCATCHNPEHSLGFEYGSFLPRVSHAANAAVLAMPAEERAKVLAARRAPRKDLLPAEAAHVGSAACQSCHPAEHETWSAQPHARAVATLEAKGKAGDADCLRCHTTGYGKTGGFPAGGAPAEHPDLAAVGCESCHGPGGEHVKEDAPKRGSIVSLGDKCDSCVILQICGSCHDDENDPGFEFEVLEKIDRQRHGTIEAGTGRPKEPAAEAALPSSAVGAALEQALRIAGERG